MQHILSLYISESDENSVDFHFLYKLCSVHVCGDGVNKHFNVKVAKSLKSITKD